MESLIGTRTATRLLDFKSEGNAPVHLHDVQVTGADQHNRLLRENAALKRLNQKLMEENRSLRHSISENGTRLLGLVSAQSDVRSEALLTEEADNHVASPESDIRQPQGNNSGALKERQAAHNAMMNKNSEIHKAVINISSNQYERGTEYMRNQHEKISRLHGDVHKLQDRNRGLEAQKASLEDMVSEMRRSAGGTIELLKSNLNDSKESEEHAKASLDAATQQCLRLEATCQLAVSELEAYKKSGICFEVDDLTITGKWAHLDNLIIEMSSGHFRADFQTTNSISLHFQRQRVLSWKPNLGSIFFRAVIWHVIAEIVFPDSFSIFGKEVQGVAENVRSNLASTDGRPADMQKYISWRAETAILLDGWRIENRMNSFAGEVMRKVNSLLPQTHLTAKDRAFLRLQLRVISLRAFELASIFARSKAIYRILHSKSGSLMGRFNEEEMEMTNQRTEGADLVKVATRPGLAKAGDAEGNNCDHVTTLVKAGVCC
ncbi:hypothetical protein PG994_014802 [Apiospora phragmitis]|uniref:Uncharacterized protein n=1 Tax=Apiospora phragmitis TaxID=2905665 RepID=A0ABR1SUM7_9PEZI